jgi:hypothetical protein
MLPNGLPICGGSLLGTGGHVRSHVLQRTASLIGAEHQGSNLPELLSRNGTRWLGNPPEEYFDFTADFKVKLDAAQTAVSLESFGRRHFNESPTRPSRSLPDPGAFSAQWRDRRPRAIPKR